MFLIRLFTTWILVVSASSGFASSKSRTAQNEIEKVLRDAGYEGGVAMKNLQSGNEIRIHAEQMFPMASVFKFPIAIAILRKVEHGEFKLAQKFHLKKSDILTKLRGPLAKKYPTGEVDLTLDELLKFMVSESDNTACDFLLNAVGGPKAVTATLRKLNVDNVNVSRTESEIMATTNEPGPKNLDAATPQALLRLYEMLRDQKLLNGELTAYLLKLMTESNNPPHISNGLPKGLTLAHKSGWCDKSLCVNDTALITLPNGTGDLVMIIFLKNGVDFDQGSRTISKVANIGFEGLAHSDQHGAAGLPERHEFVQP